MIVILLALALPRNLRKQANLLARSRAWGFNLDSRSARFPITPILGRFGNIRKNGRKAIIFAKQGNPES